MRCEYCNACVISRDGREFSCYIGIDDNAMNENKKGEWGCDTHPRTIARLIRERDESCYVSTAYAQRILNPEEYEKRLIRADDPSYLLQAIFCIGYEPKEVYRRNHKKFFRAKKNTICEKYANQIWRDLVYLGFAECDKAYWEAKDPDTEANFCLNEDGFRWVAQKVGVDVIKEEK